MEQAHVRTGYFFFVYTYGMSESVARPHAELEAQKVGLRLSYVNAIKMIDSYLPGFDMKQQKDTAGKKHLDEICQDIAARREMTTPIGIKARAATPAMNKMFDTIVKDTAAQEYVVTDACTRCGTCARVCPTNNITVSDHVEFGDRCEVCYACMQNCPQGAIHLRGEKGAARFRNENVQLRDILAANA